MVRIVRTWQQIEAKGIGIVDKICSILNDVFFGPYFFQTALVLRESLLLNSILLNSESWYNLTTADIKELEHIDNVLHRRILETPVSTPISILHLELGTLPIKYLIKRRRLLYLQYILKQDKDSLMYKVFEAQSRNPQKGNWVLQIIDDINKVDLQLTFEEIKSMSKYSYNGKVKKAIRKSAFNWLIADKDKPRSGNPPKGSNLHYDQFKMQDYFLPNTMTIKQCNLLFSLRGCNYRHSYSSLTSQVCEDPANLDSQLHIP